MTYIEFLKKYWKYLAMMALLLIGLFVGRYSAPKPSVQIQEKVVTQVQKVVDEQMVQAEVDKRVAEFQKNFKTHTVTVVVTKPNGTKLQKTTTDVQDIEKSKTQEQKVVTQVVTKTEYVDRIVEKQVDVKVESPRPDWLLGVQVGGNVSGITSLPDLHVAAEVDRRIFGPFYLGLSAGPMLRLPGGSPRSVEVDLNLKATW